MRPLRTRDDILAYAAAHAPSDACARRIREDHLLCDIKTIRDDAARRCQWVVRVKAKYGSKVWTIIITCDEFRHALGQYDVEWM